MKKRFLLFLALPLLMFGVATATFSMNNREPAIAVHAEEVFVEETYTMVEDDATFILRLTSETNYTITATKAETTMTVSGVYIRNGNTVELYVDGELFDTVELDSENGTFSYIDEEEPETQEEEPKSKEITWENIETKVKEISNYQVLGMTIGTIVGGLASIGITYLFKKAEKIELHKFTEISRGVNHQYEAFMKKAEEITTNYGILQNEFKEFKEESAFIIGELKENNKLLKDVTEEEKKARLEERKFFLDMLSHNKDAVASGLAEELINYFKDKE